jgi:hypothetical protein
MTTYVQGIYRGGVLYLHELLPYPDDTAVTVTVEVIVQPDPERAELERAHALLVAAGVVKPGPLPGPVESTLPPERAAELANLFARGGPVSDLIIAERNED